MTEKTHFGYQTIDETEKQSKVAAVFDSVAGKYDIMNDVMSLGVHRFWKNWYVWQTEVKSGETVLDLAAGTGDISSRMAKMMAQNGEIQGELIASDINFEMLSRGRERLINEGWYRNLNFLLANAESLPVADNSIDLITMAFGLRNVTHQNKALAEMYRVLKPGGRVLILEFSHPTSQAFNKVYNWYSFTLLPKMGQIIAKDSDSYQYLAESIRMMPTQEELKSMFESTGFTQCEYQNLNQGIVAIHKAIKGKSGEQL